MSLDPLWKKCFLDVKTFVGTRKTLTTFFCHLGTVDEFDFSLVGTGEISRSVSVDRWTRHATTTASRTPSPETAEQKNQTEEKKVDHQVEEFNPGLYIGYLVYLAKRFGVAQHLRENFSNEMHDRHGLYWFASAHVPLAWSIRIRFLTFIDFGLMKELDLPTTLRGEISRQALIRRKDLNARHPVFVWFLVRENHCLVYRLPDERAKEFVLKGKIPRERVYSRFIVHILEMARIPADALDFYKAVQIRGLIDCCIEDLFHMLELDVLSEMNQR